LSHDHKSSEIDLAFTTFNASWPIRSVVGEWVVDVSDSGQVTCGCNSVSKSQAKINRRHVDDPPFRSEMTPLCNHWRHSGR
jgi:hypothetical protein